MRFFKRRKQKPDTLLIAAKNVLAFCYPDGKWRRYANMKGLLEIIQPLREAVEQRN